MRITVLQLHKRASYEFKYIQDRYAINSKNLTFALADGTTQSFNSEFWAEIITRRFVLQPNFNPDELIKDFTGYVDDYKNIKFEFSSNPAKASLERAKQKKGATATFIGLQFLNENEFKLIACGDSNLFLVSSANRFSAYPFGDVNLLDSNNHFINTEQLLQGQIDSSFFKSETIKYENGDKIILATDALSRLILKNPSVLKDLPEISNFDQLHSFCLKYWDSKDLEEDDISAIILSINQDNIQKIIHPPNDFSFPKEKEEEFIPGSLIQLQNPKLSDVQMNEIMNQFQGVANDFHLVKKKLWFHGVLLMTVTSLFVVNTLLFFFLISSRGNEGTDKKNVRSENVRSENATIQHYENKISDLNSEIKSLKEQIAKPEKQAEEEKQEKKSVEITPAEALKRQQELAKHGYTIKADGKWGSQSEKMWNEYKSKN
jgi:hypothetical protein